MTERDWWIVEAGTVGEVVGAEALYDGPARREWAERFLASPGHHLLLARAGDAEGPVGMVTGVELTHPDKGTEMFLYELGVAASHRRRGIGRGLVDALAELARANGCYGMWVAVDADNEPALATYAAAGGRTEGPPCEVPLWHFDRRP
ncbi:GNAT family N-acetyltransferase [Streptomyces sp. 3MP-14]|uniref:GNAT family N-acetyltransferase n=1 Tax=Streptomyces mimosae TaxID=2586635 RepID=A0A5N6A813_9ACTN|nr:MULTISPECIES: GNAT family N-acetyltransferase [Streptomyces]KAB8163870.1 GNAT family N-acetyltransferase [Streptomyces mimosae]KAB8175313.1 GNAT family N-acetyltransferase [Streptomyces sp. 3MP-14]